MTSLSVSVSLSVNRQLIRCRPTCSHPTEVHPVKIYCSGTASHHAIRLFGSDLFPAIAVLSTLTPSLAEQLKNAETVAVVEQLTTAKAVAAVEQFSREVAQFVEFFHE